MKLAYKMTDQEVMYGLMEKCAEYGLTDLPLFKSSFEKHFTFKFPKDEAIKEHC